jgi:hypothetical protein
MFLLLVGGACGGLDGAPEWSDQDLWLSVHYDTVASGVTDDTLPLQVYYDTTRNVAGYALLWATVTARNLSDQSLVGETRPGGWRFRAFGNEERTGDPTWTEGSEWFGPSSIEVITLPPGGTQTFHRRFLPLDSIVARRGPGPFHFSARLWGSVSQGPPKWLTDWIPAGSIDLVP